jgi:hypothetical protein
MNLGAESSNAVGPSPRPQPTHCNRDRETAMGFVTKTDDGPHQGAVSGIRRPSGGVFVGNASAEKLTVDRIGRIDKDGDLR